MKPVALYYLALLDDIRAAARALGYAIGLHGSMQRDFDLIACPWRDDAKPAEELVEAIRVLVGGNCMLNNPAVKPHGRRAWSIHLIDYEKQEQFGVTLGTAIIDLSVMPRACDRTYPVANDLFEEAPKP